MADDENIVDENGTIHDQGWDGSYHQRQGLFGSQRDTDAFGRPRVDRDLLGNPRPATDALGRQVTSDSGQPLYTSTGSGGRGWGFPNIKGDWVAGLLIISLWVAFQLVRGLILLIVHACRGSRPAAYALLALFAGGVGLVVLMNVLPRLIAPQWDVVAVPNAYVSPTPVAAPPAIFWPSPVPTYTATPRGRLVVGNTGGDGVYLRHSPRMSDKAHAWPDGTVLEPTGRTATGDGQEWYEVHDPGGFTGWVPAIYVIAQ
ncbi:MAG TPA: SH3 domain-containing protein [Anaerolineae bacterium]|nr:SH3 domain-containing protein [Anaerolineae bacterium]HOQ98922.1 SH3 domain-containing protein [Anaerolineae bacterium]HPL26518.1 SH3 domain-containing protein [Anaerolineae bacterium]